MIGLSTLRSLARRLGVFILPALLSGGSGCTGQAGQQLTLECQRQGQALSQGVAAAYLSRAGDGDADIVLLDAPSKQCMDGVRCDAPVRQVMHIRVLWNPARDLKADHSSASNATIHWYVMGNRPDSGGDVLEYAGTGFVLLGDTDNGTELTIRSAAVRAVACHGKLCDPVGRANIHGTVRVITDQRRVRLALSQVRMAVAAASALPNNVAYRAKPERPSSLAR